MKTLEQQINDVWSILDSICGCELPLCLYYKLKKTIIESGPLINNSPESQIVECVEKTEQLIKQNLAQALVSPNKYIREFAESIAKEEIK